MSLKLGYSDRLRTGHAAINARPDTRPRIDRHLTEGVQILPFVPLQSEWTWESHTPSVSLCPPCPQFNQRATHNIPFFLLVVTWRLSSHSLVSPSQR
jgi:hypothetical protein